MVTGWKFLPEINKSSLPDIEHIYMSEKKSYHVKEKD